MSENATTVKSLLDEMHAGPQQVRSSRKDEIRVMQTMLSDDTYEVSIYGKDGIEGTYNPAKDFRSMCSSIISNVAKISSAEATQLMDGYSLKKAEASTMVDISKEFVNTYIGTGRKLPFGGRENSDISISSKKVEESVRLYPRKVGVNDDGTDRYSKAPTKIPAHDSLRVYAPCPAWVK